MALLPTDCVRFVPAEVIGLPSVSEVAVFLDRIEICTAGAWRTFHFHTFARRQENLPVYLFKRLLRRPVLRVVGEREFCTDRRYVRFYTRPELTIFTPPDHDQNYGNTFICRINLALMAGGFKTDDLS